MPAQNNGAFTLRLRLRTRGGLPVDVTGWAFQAQLRRTPEAATALAELTTAGGGIVAVSAAEGALELRVPFSLLSGLRAGVVHFDLRRTDQSEPTVLARGHFPVLQGVTR